MSKYTDNTQNSSTNDRKKSERIDEQVHPVAFHEQALPWDSSSDFHARVRSWRAWFSSGMP
jgi:hypothetical protein